MTKLTKACSHITQTENIQIKANSNYEYKV